VRPTVQSLIRNFAFALTFALAFALALAQAAASAGVSAVPTVAVETATVLQQARQAAAADPTNPGPRFALGVLLIDRQDDAEALDLFVLLTQQFPSLPEPYNNIALLHARAGRWDAARVALEAALRNDPGHSVARENLGDVHLQLALQAWEVAASGATSGAAGPTLQRKLRLGRELAAANTAAALAAPHSR
jgi:Flp pilus assembly protein TadD